MNKKSIVTIGVLVAVILISIIVAYYSRQDSPNLNQDTEQPDNTSTETPSTEQPQNSFAPRKTSQCSSEPSSSGSNWQTYKCDKFEFEYPKQWTVKQYSNRYKILSPSDLTILEAPGYTDQPVGFDVLTFNANSTQSLDTWLMAYLGITSLDIKRIDKDNSRIAIIDIKNTKLRNNTNIYMVQQMGIGEGDYVYYFKHNDLSLAIAAYYKKDLTDASFLHILNSIKIK